MKSKFRSKLCSFLKKHMMKDLQECANGKNRDSDDNQYVYGI